MRQFARFLLPAFITLALQCVSYAAEATPTTYLEDQTISLEGAWIFIPDPNDQGLQEKWYEPKSDRQNWETVTVPHTWQVDPKYVSYMGIAWYTRTLNLGERDLAEKVYLEFDSIYRDAAVWVNGEKAGEHNGSGWTPFRFAVERLLNFNGQNEITVRVDNRFSEKALPYLKSSDWPADGGIFRSVRLRLRSADAIDSIHVDAETDDDFKYANVFFKIKTQAKENKSNKIEAYLFHPDGQRTKAASIDWNPTVPESLTLSTKINNPQLWHFDHPNLYTVEVQLLKDGKIVHQKLAKFGIRKVEVKDGFYYLNGEPMRLMGVEWMPGSDPRYGMAESPEFMREVLQDMKKLNCIITRFHWQQDDSVFDFCDSEGILVQEEVPAWGGKTMEGDLADIQRMQMEEMIPAHYNHPSIYAWGLCNEIGEQGKALEFCKRGIDIARKLNPQRLLTFASNALQSPDLPDHPQDHASYYADFIEWNDYYGSWYGGGVTELKANMERIQKAFPGKSLVISEYGLCECDPKNPTGDQTRTEILQSRTQVYRESPNVAGAIFFDYNDYRTHIGDKGQGSFQQRVHGVVDLLNQPKPSYEVLRREMSPIRSIALTSPKTESNNTTMEVEITTRSLENDFPAYTLRGYELIWIAYNNLDQPIGTGKRTLPEIKPGSVHKETIDWPAFDNLSRVAIEVFRPTGYSVRKEEWKRD